MGIALGGIACHNEWRGTDLYTQTNSSNSVTRTTVKSLDREMERLNQALKRPLTARSDEGWNVGALTYIRQNGYYTIQVVANRHGAVHSIETGCTLREAYNWVLAGLKVIALNNEVL